MGSIFSKLFKKKESTIPDATMDKVVRPEECNEILALNEEIQQFCAKDHYVARSEYRHIVSKYQKTVEYFAVLEKSGMLDAFCMQHKTLSSADYYTLMNYSEEPAPAVKRIRAKDMPPRNADTNGAKPKMPEKRATEVAVDPRQMVECENGLTGKVYYKDYDLYEIVECLLSCLEHISEKRFYSLTILVATVRGGNRKQMREGNLMEVPEYGRYPDMSRDDMWAIALWLVDNHYMLRTKEHFPKMHPTYEGRHYKETLTVEKLNDLKTYLEDPYREVVEDEDLKETER